MNIEQFPLSFRSRNLLRCCRHPAYETTDDSFVANFAFRDRGSRFSILKSNRTLAGPDECFAHYQIDSRPLFDKLLGMEIDFPHLPAPQKARWQMYNSMNYYRSHVEELFTINGVRPVPPIAGTCFIFCPAADRLGVLYRLTNNSQADVEVLLRWLATPAGKGEAATIDHGFAYSMEQKVQSPYRAAAEVRCDQADVAFALAGGGFASNWVTRTIPAGKSIEIAFSAAFNINAPAEAPALPVAAARRALTASVKDAEADYARLPQLPKAMAAYGDLVLKAAGTIRSLRFADRDPAGKLRNTMHAGKCGVASTWFWDTSFTMPALGLIGEAEGGFGAASCLCGGIKEDGQPPVKYSAGSYIYAYQQPILAAGIGHLAAAIPNDKFLRQVYAPLSRYVNHWLTVADVNRNGLAEFPANGLAWDDSYRWHDKFPIAYDRGQTWWQRPWGHMTAAEFESVDTNCHLYLECRTMERMAARLGKAADAAAWAARAKALAAAINRELFNEKTGLYEDRRIADGRFTGMITPANFMPIYAGIAPRGMAADMCRKYLLDPDRFYSVLPFPTLDMKNAAFRSGGFLFAPPEYPGALCNHAYWHGRTWPHVSFWMTAALHQAGLTAEADAAARRILDAMGKSEAIYECYDPLTGQGNGYPEFLWSSGAVISLAYQMYKKDPVGRL